MSEEWQYQVRINLNEERAETARRDANDAAYHLGDILAKHNATLKCQYDAFAGYCEAAEAEGIDQYPLYQWTKDTIDDPVKKAKYRRFLHSTSTGTKSMTAKRRILWKRPAAARRGLLDKLSKHDTNPANNPQPLKKYRQS